MQYKKRKSKGHVYTSWRKLLAFGLCAVMICSSASGVLSVFAQTDKSVTETDSEEASSELSEGGNPEETAAETVFDEENNNIDAEPEQESIEKDAEGADAPVEEQTPLQKTVQQLSEVGRAAVISISSEDELLKALGEMRNGDAKTLKLTGPLVLTKSMQLTSSGTYSVTIIGDGANTVVSSSAAIRLFTLKKGTINLTFDNVILDGGGKAGGVVVSDGAKLTLNGSSNSIIRNMKDTHGAAIRAAGANAELKNLTLQDNTADENGGAVYAYSSRIDVDNVTFQKNKAGENGGALYQYDTSGIILIKSSIFTDNSAGNYGGAIAGISTGLILQQATVSGNKAESGGGIYLRTGAMSAQLTVTSSSRIAGNTAVYNGGGVYVESARAGVNLTASAAVENNKAENGNGGGLYLHESANVHVNNAMVSGNKAKNGGGLFIYNSNTLTCVNSTIKGNEAAENGGGAYCSVTSSISSTTFSGNKAKNGGGLYNANSTRIILNSSVMDGNTARQNGGAIGLDENSWNISAGMNTFVRNSAAYAVDELSDEDQKIHDTIMMVNTGYGTVNYTYPFKHALNNYDVWNTGESADLVFDVNTDEPVSEPPKTQKYAVGASILLPIETPVRENYTFLGWSEERAVATPEYVTNPDASSKEEQDLWYTMKEGTNILYAVWVYNPRMVTISFDVNGGSFKNSSDEIIVSQIEAGSLLGSMPGVSERFGYEFIGWYDKNAGEDLEAADPAERDKDWGNEWKEESFVERDITLYARWKQVPFPIGDDVFGDKYEQLLSEALNSARVVINIHLYGDIRLTDAMRVGNMADTGLVVNFFSQSKTAAGQIDLVKLIQTGQERHFYIRNAGTKAVIGLNNVNITSTSGYGGIEVSKGSLTVNGTKSEIGGNYPRITDIKKHSSGGAILAKDGAKVTLSKIDLVSNEAGYGGAISAEGKDTEINLNDVVLSSNKAEFGGGIDLSDRAKLTMKNKVDIKSNQATQAGGGLYVSDETVSVEGENVTFLANKAETHGGGIGLGILGDEGSELLGNITLSGNINWTGNEASSAYAVDIVKTKDKELYGHLQGGGIEVWNGNHISYLYKIYTVKYDMGDAPATVTETDSSFRYGEGYELSLPEEAVVDLDKTNEPWKYRTFEGWSQDRYETNTENAKGALTFGGKRTEITLYPVWQHATATVTFDPGNGGKFGNDETDIDKLIEKLENLYPDYEFKHESGKILATVDKGTVLSPPDSGYLTNGDSDMHFQKWQKENVDFDFTDAIIEDIILTAAWGIITPNHVLLIFHTNGGTYIEPQEVSVTTQSCLVNEPEKIGHGFEGWYQDEDLTIECDLNQLGLSGYAGEEYHIYAKWNVNQYTLVTDVDPTDGGTILINSKVSDSGKDKFDHGTAVKLKAVPGEGYYFTGWLVRPVLDDGYSLSDELNITITGNMTVTANFEKQTHLVTFYEGRRLLQTISVVYGDSFSTDKVPEAPEGYEQSWSDGNGEVIFSGDITVLGDMSFNRTITGKEYTVALHGKGGTIGGADKITKKVRYNEAVGELDEEVIYDYHEFAGWSNSKDYNHPWDLNADAVHGDLDLYAMWDTMDAPAPKVNGVRSSLTGENSEICFDDPKPVTVSAGLVNFLVDAEPVVPDPTGHTERDVLTYRWVQCDLNGNEIRVMSDNDLMLYTANLQTTGDFYCYLEVTNTNEHYSGKKSASVRSGTMKIKVNERLTEAPVPIILENPDDLYVKAGDTASFRVKAVSSDDYWNEDNENLSYQWYELTEDGPKKINGATDKNYSFTTDTVGEFLYYVEVTNTMSDSNGNVISQSVISDTARLTVWTDYTVTYHDDGADRGQPPEDKNTYDVGDEVTVLDNTGGLEKEEHKFIGWTMDKDSTDIVLKAGDTFPMPEEDVNFYPVWKSDVTVGASTYKVIYHDDGAECGAAPEDTDKYAVGDEVTVLDNIGELEKEGYHFVGWSTRKDGTGATLMPGRTFLMPEGDVDFYPVWEPDAVLDAYSVIYSAGGANSGYPPVDTDKYRAGDTVTVMGNTGKLARTGYKFIGWLTDPDDSETVLKPGDTLIMAEEDIRLTAAWEKNKESETDTSQEDKRNDGKNDSGKAKNNSPGTGDSLPLITILCMFISAGILVLLYVLRRRFKNKK